MESCGLQAQQYRFAAQNHPGSAVGRGALATVGRLLLCCSEPNRLRLRCRHCVVGSPRKRLARGTPSAGSRFGAKLYITKSLGGAARFPGTLPGHVCERVLRDEELARHQFNVSLSTSCWSSLPFSCTRTRCPSKNTYSKCFVEVVKDHSDGALDIARVEQHMDEPLACFPDCTAQAMHGRIYAHHVDSYPSGDAGRVGPHPCSVRRARESRSAVRCLVLLSWLRPTWVHRARTLMKERAPLRISTTSLSGCTFWNLQTQRSQHRPFEYHQVQLNCHHDEGGLDDGCHL